LLLEQLIELGDLDRLALAFRLSLRRHGPVLASGLGPGFRLGLGLRARRQRLEQRRILEELSDQPLRARLAIHVREEIGSCWRASRSLRSASTFRATAAGEKSSMLSKVRSTIRLPSPVSVFGTWKATRGFIAFKRWSKLSMSMSRNFRSATSGRASAGL